jgi:23S rRNA (cytosine1962-C5)-methyltransferase
VDLSSQALELANQSWQLNDLAKVQHETLAVDIFDFIQEGREPFDVVIVDPPSMSHSEKTKEQATQAYIDLFARSTGLVKSGGDLLLSSCSSHISFNDFLEIIDEALSQSRQTGQILRISGQGADHPIPHFCRELRYLKFVHVKLHH